MDLNSEYLYLGALAFVTLLILDFIVVEIVLKLGVFAFGKAILRVIMILALEFQAISFYLSNMYPQDTLLYLNLGSIAWLIWNPLYYYMLIEQNTFWMRDKVKKYLYISFTLFTALVITIATISFLVGFQVLSFEFLIIDQRLDIVGLVYISLTEFYINYKIYQFSKGKLKSVSPVLWNKVELSLVIFTLCVFLDIVNVFFENFVNPNLAYVVKTCSFSFKIVFECMCFQFIKGIIVSIEQ